MSAIELLHCMASYLEGFAFFTDYKKLVFLFDSLPVVPDLSQSPSRKVIGWAVRLPAYNYVCVHISGNENDWADLMSR